MSGVTPPTPPQLHRIEDAEEFSRLDHPVVRYDIGAGFAAPAYAWGTFDDDGAAAFLRRSDRGVPGLAALGSGAGIRALLASGPVRELIRERQLSHVSVPREVWPEVAQVVPWRGGGDWDWMWTTTAAMPLPHQDRIEVVDETSAGELTAFLAHANPRTHGQPFARPGQLWVVLRESDGTGDLVACGSWEPAVSGVPVLAGIAVDPCRRGAGYGAAITAYLTSAAVERFGACTLGMFADNVTARRLYHRLGYQDGARWATRWVVGSAD